MAESAPVTTPVLVIDTSYFLELFQVPGHSSPKRSKEIKARFERANQLGGRLYVPLPVVFELANHIAHVRTGADRKRLANFLVGSVEASIRDESPWILVPAKDALNELRELCASFKATDASQSVGLTDACIIEEARRLRRKYPVKTYRVHIWTTDDSLKAHEPDVEPDRSQS
jgi:predicted nucleic acid-binding protein